MVVRFGIGDGLGRDRIMGKESGLEQTPSITSWPPFHLCFRSTESLHEQMPALICGRRSLYAQLCERAITRPTQLGPCDSAGAIL
jgi:hypothetical protein